MIKHTSEKLIVQTSRLQKDILADVGEKYLSKIIVIGNPLDTNTIQHKMVEKLDVEIMKKIEGKRVITFVSSFKSTKNHWNLLKSFKLLHEKYNDTILILIGGDGEFEKKIKDMAKEQSIANAVIFVGKTNNPFKFLNNSDVFVLPSITEGIPNVLIEALAVGVPVIATDCPSGPREILYDNPDLESHTKGIEYADYGILIEEFESEPDFNIENITEKNITLAMAMEQMLFNSEINKRYRRAAVEKSKLFDLDVYSRELKRVIVYCAN